MDETLLDNHKAKAQLSEYISNYTIIVGIVFSLSFLNYKIVIASIVIFFLFKIYTNVVIKHYSILNHKILLFVFTHFSLLIFCISSANVIGKSTVFFNYNFLNVCKIMSMQIIILLFLYIVFVNFYSHLYKMALLKTKKESKLTDVYLIAGSMSLVGASLYRAISKIIQPSHNEIVFIFGLFVFLLAIVVAYASAITFFQLKECLQKQSEK